MSGDAEHWKCVAGRFDGFRYRISNRGRVISVRRGDDRPRLMTPFRDKDNYLRVNLYDADDRLFQSPVHTLVAEAFICHRPAGCTVNHKDFDKNNNHVENLEWLSGKANTEHAKIAGRMKLGPMSEEQKKKISAAMMGNTSRKKGTAAKLAKLGGQ